MIFTDAKLSRMDWLGKININHSRMKLKNYCFNLRHHYCYKIRDVNELLDVDWQTSTSETSITNAEHVNESLNFLSKPFNYKVFKARMFSRITEYIIFLTHHSKSNALVFKINEYRFPPLSESRVFLGKLLRAKMV